MATGTRYTIEIYVVSDSLDMESRICMRSPVPLPAIKPDLELRALLEVLKFDAASMFDKARDWRLMTDAEIEGYLEEEACDNGI